MSFEIKDLTVSLNDRIILHSLNLSIKRGEFLSLLGASGSGKSTLLKTLCGVIPQSHGALFADGKNLDSIAPNKRNFVLVFQDIRLFPHLTVAENVAFPLRIKGIRKSERLNCAFELLQQVHLDGMANCKPAQLSGGQQQRVALARALAAQPDLLLLDEPFSGLDSSLRMEMSNLLYEIHQKYSITTILVTHDYEEAFMLSDRVAIIDQGNIMQCGTPKELFEQPSTLQIAKYFFRNNHVSGTVNDGIFNSALFTTRVTLPNGDYCAVIPPSCFSVTPQGDFYTIKKAIYMGDCYKLTVASADAMMETFVGSNSSCQTGETIQLNIQMEKVLFFQIDSVS